jgi:hypothetical protein
MGCAAINARIASAGALVLDTGPITYDRYVRDLGFCEASQITVPDFIRSADHNVWSIAVPGAPCTRIGKSVVGGRTDQGVRKRSS